MKQRTFFMVLFLVAATVFFFASCKKEKPADPSAPLSYTSLVAENDTLLVFTSTNITAAATGDDLSYTWTLEPGSSGDLIGSGAVITYAAQEHCVGMNTITCTVSDGVSTEAKSVTILVF